MTPEPVKINHKTELEKKMFVKKKNITRATNFFKINRFKLNSSYQSISCFKETDTFGHLGSLGFTISKTLIEAEEKWRHIYKFYSLLLSNLFKQFTLIQISWESLTLLLCWFQEKITQSYLCCIWSFIDIIFTIMSSWGQWLLRM